LSNVSLRTLSLDSYKEIIGEKELQNIRSLAKKLKDKSVVHINSTAYGGGVAEMLQRIVPLMNDVGLHADWKVIKGENEFFDVTKSFHNALQGKEMPLTEEMKQPYLKYNKMNAEQLELDYDYVVVHDPQPLALIDYQPKKRGKWVWRCHIDLSQPNQTYWRFMEPYLAKYDAYIFTAKQYIKSPLEKRNVALITPSIDPLSDKSKPLTDKQVLSVLERYDVNPDYPLLNQVARFDPWKDPLGVIDTYRIIKKVMPKLQLLLISSMATDDPEGWYYYEQTARHAGEDPDIQLLTDLKGVHDLEVNAFQRASDVTLLKSIREGFGLTVTESLWKQVPVVGGNVGGIPLQVIDGKTGFLVNSVVEAAEKTLYLLKHPQEAKQMGKKGKEYVKENFLVTGHLAKYLKLFQSLA
jgi:trehalose synthase